MSISSLALVQAFKAQAAAEALKQMKKKTKKNRGWRARARVLH